MSTPTADRIAAAEPDRTSSRLHDAVEIAGAGIAAAIVAFVGLKAIGSIGWPAFNTSNVTRSITTLGQAAAIAAAVGAVVWARYAFARGPWMSRTLPSLLSAVASALMVTVTLGMPLGLAVIVFTVVITAIYVQRANSEFDRLSDEVNKAVLK